MPCCACVPLRCSVPRVPLALARPGMHGYGDVDGSGDPGWLIYELTDSALQLGLVRGIQAIPMLLLSPIAGSAADRYSRKMQMVLSNSSMG